MYTDGRFIQNTPVPDGHIFVGAGQWASATALNTIFSAFAEGNVAYTIPAATTVSLYANPTLLLRSGIYSSFFDGERAFGTKGPPPIPGPSTVVGTSSPRALPGRPPLTASQMATVAGPVKEPMPKGIRIQSVDVIGEALTVAATSVQFGLTSTVFGASGAGPTVVTINNLITYGNNGLPLAPNAIGPVTTTIQSGNVNFLVPTTPIEVIAHLGVTTPAGGTFVFYGINLNIGYNYN